MVITPDSTVNLYRDIPIENGLQIAFNSKTAQENYFAGKLVRANAECTMIKKTGQLQLEIPGTLVTKCNYISFVNPSFDNRVFYAMITDYDYINNECTSISYVIDYFQSYMFDLSFKEGTTKTRESLTENEWDLAQVNPYNPDIYPLCTSEDLGYGKDIEPPVYEYAVDDTPSAFINEISTFTEKFDGYYLIDTTSVGSGQIADWADGYKLYVVISLAPIDFSEISEEVKDEWDRLMGLVSYVGGFYVTPTNDYNSSNYDLLNNQMRATNLIMFPSALLLPDDSELLPESGHPEAGPNRVEARLLFQKIIDSLTYLNAISQIVSIYSIPLMYIGSALLTDKEFNSVTVAHEKGSVYPSGYPMVDERLKNLGYDVNSPKLFKHPFSYLRVEAPDLNTKEYKFEDFYDLAYLPYENTNAKNQGFYFRMYSTLDGAPKVFLTPYRYKMNSVAFPNATSTNEIRALEVWKSLNHLERMEYSDFPMVPFNTDGYLTFLSNQVMNTTRANTADFQDQLSMQKLNAVASAGNTMTNLLGSVISSASGIGTAKVADRKSGRSGLNAFGREHELRARAGGFYSDVASTGSGVFGGIADFANTALTTQSAEAKIEEANKYLGGIGGPNIDYGRYNDTKPAYANHIYHAGSSPTDSVMRGVGNYWFKFTYVRPRIEIAKKYDEYFKYYGYNQAGRLGKPLIANFIAGESSDDTKLPHWEETEDGKSYYIQTMNCEVTGVPMPIINFVKNLFNSGVRFLKGDEL